MFLQTLLRDNPDLADYALYLHAKGLIQPDTYIIDRDTLRANISKFRKEAGALTIFPMTKQIGRSPWILDDLKNEGFAFCAVDFREALTLINRGCTIGHVGHLVQIPQKLIPIILDKRPHFITVYSLEQALMLNHYAKEKGIIQNIFLRPVVKAYPAQESMTYTPETLLKFAQEMSELPHVKIAGLTSFPCFLFENGEIRATPNVELLNQCFDLLKSEGFPLQEKNMPSHNSCEALPLIQECGATQVEPGHSLTGTCPSNQHKQGHEKIALCYVTEVSHHADGLSYAFGGGWYRRSHWSTALVEGKEVSIIPPDSGNIDYTYAFKGILPIGAGVLGAFRTQIFTTRSQVAVVSGLSKGEPTLVGISDALGREMS